MSAPSSIGMRNYISVKGYRQFVSLLSGVAIDRKMTTVVETSETNQLTN